MSTPPPPHCHDAGARLEDGHAVVHVRAGLAVGEAVEEAAEAQPLGLLLLLALRVLEVAKVCAARAMSGQADLRPLGARARCGLPHWRLARALQTPGGVIVRHCRSSTNRANCHPQDAMHR